MRFNWAEFLKLARALQDSEGKLYSVEASERSAVSRAYYAVFCSIRNYAEEQLGFSRTGKGDDHRRLVEHLQRVHKAKIATRVERLRRWRNLCDYEDRVDNLDALVNKAVKAAESILSQLNLDK